jgi:hypothetical protein
VDIYEEEEALHCGDTGLLRMAEEEQRQGAHPSLCQTKGRPIDVCGGPVGLRQV